MPHDEVTVEHLALNECVCELRAFLNGENDGGDTLAVIEKAEAAMSSSKPAVEGDDAELADFLRHHNLFCTAPDGRLERAADRIEALSRMDGVREALREWALEKSATHHRLAHENKHLRAEHIASSTAYRELANEGIGKALSSLSGNSH
jgi:hypothetical protein